VEIGDTFTITMNGKSISIVATAATVANVCLLLKQAFDETTIAEFLELTCDNENTYLKFTSVTPGKPFTLTASESDGGSADTQTMTVSTTTSNQGPNDWGTATNWEGDALPTTGDTVFIPAGGSSILYGLNQSSVTLASLVIDQGFTSFIGLSEINADGSTTYDEYRDTYLRISATSVVLGDGTGTGSGRIKINFGSAQTAVTVRDTGTPETTSLPAVLLLGTHASNVITIVKGSVGIAAQPGETSTVATLNVGYLTNQTDDSNVRCGSGVTLTTINVTGGRLSVESNSTTMTNSGGEITLLAGTVTTLNLDSGTVYDRTTGTITTLIVGSQGVYDASRDPRGKTVTNCDLFAGASLDDPHGRVTFTNGIDCNRCSLNEVTLTLPSNKRFTIGSVS
jgi:hypothetical protein